MKFVKPSGINGTLDAPPSKSMTIRAVAAALLSEGKTTILNPSNCDDAAAALSCAKSLGAKVKTSKGSVEIESKGIPAASHTPLKLNCNESGLCIRLFTPISSLSTSKTILTGSRTLLTRSVGMMELPLKQLGATCSTNGGLPPVTVQGALKGGSAEIDGSESSQFLTGLLMALPICKTDSKLTVKNLKSRPYIEMTLEMMNDFGVTAIADWRNTQFKIPGNQHYSPRKYKIEGDWSGASFMLVAGAIAGAVTITSLRNISHQADCAILAALVKAGAKVTVSSDTVSVEKGTFTSFEFDATDSPDLFPPLAALACNCNGTSRLHGVSRLSGKESNRGNTLSQELGRMGAKISLKGDIMEITGKQLGGGEVDSHNDHRIAMACAIAALTSETGAKIKNAECVSKSYPQFFEELRSLQVIK